MKKVIKYRFMVATLALFLGTACDPVVRFEPITWTKSDTNRWQTYHGRVLFECLGISAFPGADFVAQTYWISPPGDDRLTIESVALHIGGRSFEADPESSVDAWVVDGHKRIDMLFFINGVSLEKQQSAVVEIRYSVNYGEPDNLAIRLVKQ